MADQEQTPDSAQDSSPTFDFDEWYEEQPEHVRKGYESRTQGLHSALESERNQRKELAKELKKLSEEAAQGSEAKKALDEISTRLELAEQRTLFYEQAMKPEIGCSNVKAAFLVAQADGLFKRTGEPDWAAIRSAAPELFQPRKSPPGNAGNGVNSPSTQKGDMNEWIRQSARGG